jgi:cyclophilin family peptidyl-prolyl cis-trans isomerase
VFTFAEQSKKNYQTMRYSVNTVIGLGFFLSGCMSKKFEIPNEQVVATLTSYAKQYETNERITLQTSEGDITLKLYAETPLHRANFLHLCKNQYYNHGLFYRIADALLIQGGNQPDIPRLKYELPQEINPEFYHKRGAIAMASDKPGKFSSATEFYIVAGRKYTQMALDEFQQELKKSFSKTQQEVYKTIGGDPRLDGNYTVFGEVESGMDVVDRIAAKKVYQTDKPVQKITFKIK